MTRNRLATLATLAMVAVAGLTVLMAARDPADKSAESAKGSARERTNLVCIGSVDTEEKMIGIFPDNYPQPSQVTKVLVKEGDEVQKGQRLLDLDRDQCELNVELADIGVTAARTELAKALAMIRAYSKQVEVLEKELEAKEAELDAKKKELADTKRSIDSGRLSPVELGVPEAAVKAADLTLKAARIKWEAGKADVPTYLEDLANAGIKKALQQKRQAEKARDQVSCTAKADGKIIRSFVSEGSSFGPTTREPAFWFVKKGPLLVRAEVTQEFAHRVSKGETAAIEDESDSKQQWAGKVTKVGDQFLPKRHGTGGGLDMFPPSDERVLECLVSIDLADRKSVV